MAGKNSPDYECGQIIHCLKMSRLNYLGNETPYSAYITIRKTFISESPNVKSNDDDAKQSAKEDEVKRLKEHNTDLEIQLAQAKFKAK